MHTDHSLKIQLGLISLERSMKSLLRQWEFCFICYYITDLNIHWKSALECFTRIPHLWWRLQPVTPPLLLLLLQILIRVCTYSPFQKLILKPQKTLLRVKKSKTWEGLYRFVPALWCTWIVWILLLLLATPAYEEVFPYHSIYICTDYATAQEM